MFTLKAYIFRKHQDAYKIYKQIYLLIILPEQT